jgi:hypothetical protein
MKRGWIVLWLCAALVGCGSAPKQPAHQRRVINKRPPKRQMLSPTGGYMVTSETPSAKKPERDIVIARPGEKREILRFPFRKQVDVIWAPDESGVAVVDLVLENETRVVVFGLPDGRPLFELRREQVCELNPELPCGTAYSHVFFSNIVWLAPDRIQATVDMLNPLEQGLPPQIRGTVVAAFPR